MSVQSLNVYMDEIRTAKRELKQAMREASRKYERMRLRAELRFLQDATPEQAGMWRRAHARQGKGRA